MRPAVEDVHRSVHTSGYTKSVRRLKMPNTLLVELELVLPAVEDVHRSVQTKGYPTGAPWQEGVPHEFVPVVCGAFLKSIF